MVTTHRYRIWVSHATDAYLSWRRSMIWLDQQHVSHSHLLDTCLPLPSGLVVRGGHHLPWFCFADRHRRSWFRVTLCEIDKQTLALTPFDILCRCGSEVWGVSIREIKETVGRRGCIRRYCGRSCRRRCCFGWDVHCSRAGVWFGWSHFDGRTTW